jgi:UDP-2,3-diacylglucosamine hydrolase
VSAEGPGNTTGAGSTAWHRVAAPAGWHTIEFISDLHLSAAMPTTHAAFESYLDNCCADAVFILGDLFELWVGDDAAALPFEQRCVQALRRAATQRPIFFMVGNRDFLVGAAMCREAGLTALPDPSVLVAFGTNMLLSHGDALCLDDVQYQDFRRLVRSPAWQSEFLAKPLAERLRIAGEIRAHSASRKRFDGASSADIDKPTAVSWLREAHCDTLIHGHTHRPGSDVLAGGLTRQVLSDWDLDQTPPKPRAEVLRWSAAGLQRLAPAQAHRATG